MIKKRIASIGGWFGQASLVGFFVGAGIVFLLSSQAIPDRISTAVGSLALAISLKYAGGWLYGKWADPINIEYAENGAVIGYKVLSCNTNQTVESPIYPYLWKTGWNKSEGSRFSSRSGFYAYRDFQMARLNRGTAYYFIAKLEMAGKVVICENGYRSEYARVVEVMSTGFAFRRDLEDHMNLLLVKRI